MEIRPHSKPLTPSRPETAPAHYVDPDLRFEVAVPERWQRRRTLRSEGYWRVAFTAPGGTARAVVDVMLQKQSEDPGASWERLSRRLTKAAGRRYRKIGINSVPFGGEAGSRWEFLLTGRDGKTLRKIDIGAYHLDSGYAILCEAPEGSFSEYEPQFEAIIRSFKFTGAD